MIRFRRILDLPHLGSNSSIKNLEKNKNEPMECEIVSKGIERFEKQLMQVIRIKIIEEPLDFPLVKKCNTIDIPAVHTTVANLPKAL